MLLAACLIALPTMSQAFEGILIHKTTNTPSGVNPGMEAMQKMLANMPPEQKKMIEERMKQAMGDNAAAPKVSTQNTYVKRDKVRMDFDQEEEEDMFVIIDMKERLGFAFCSQKSGENGPIFGVRLCNFKHLSELAFSEQVGTRIKIIMLTYI